MCLSASRCLGCSCASGSDCSLRSRWAPCLYPSSSGTLQLGGGNGLTFVWLIGAVASYLWTAGWENGRRKLQLGICAFAFGTACLVGRGLKIDWKFQDIGMTVCEALILIGGLSIMDGIGPLSTALRGVCLFFASYSFSLYLVHNTILIMVLRLMPGVMGAAALPFGIVLCHVCALLLYLPFEQHYRYVGSWLKRGRFSPVRTSRAGLNASGT